ncbi:IS200/IS605 family accessory protein TnpB-related protein [Butyrivibrio sp. AC2005]|uniref:IS200/IS605 family accessory protein TnpB-related protein n=1 Tax=Butyrivibrio sp. AC2005 TaxID=1280672 RepID=UPI00041152A3|nr:IS200/IS605 family accessory protein TnpB-related protein [Butyrivibrio sp. AC2005]
MKITTTYKVKIKHYNHIFKATIRIYRKAVDFLIEVCLANWNEIIEIPFATARQSYVEKLIHRTKGNPSPVYDFDKNFYKMPTYLRRAAISDAIGKVSSYKSNLAGWEAEVPSERGSAPAYPRAGFSFPTLYKNDMYKLPGKYKAKIKVYTRNTWDFITVDLRKSDIDYIENHCSNRKKLSPTLRKRGKEWFLDFPFEENVKLDKKDILSQRIVAVDLGVNSAATVSVMQADGTVLGRHFFKLPKEYDSLKHSVGRIKKAQQHGSHKTPILWAKAKGINNDIAVKTATFIMDIAAAYKVTSIVFEHLDIGGKKRGSKKQKLQLWKARYVQSMIADKAHRLGLHVSTINAWNTSRLAFDGSGRVLRGREDDLGSYSVCRFANGKVYNCDLSASYNIGARYFIREILKSLPVKERLALEAKVPQTARRSTCTLSTLINLYGELYSM